MCHGLRVRPRSLVLVALVVPSSAVAALRSLRARRGPGAGASTGGDPAIDVAVRPSGDGLLADRGSALGTVVPPARALLGRVALEG